MHGRRRAKTFVRVLGALALGATAVPASAVDAVHARPARVSIIIDDVGNSLARGRRVIALPAPVALAILPHTAHGSRLAREAHRAHKEVLLHLPMQPLNQAEPGPGAIEVGMPAREIAVTLDYDLRTVPHAIGVNNHMGSRVTRDQDTMRALLDALRARGNLFFVDSLTDGHSTATRTAQTLGVPALARDVFLDHDLDAGAIRARFTELVATARQRGHAIGIGHPHPETLSAIEAWLATAARENIRVVPLSDLLRQPKEAHHGERARTAGAGM